MNKSSCFSILLGLPLMLVACGDSTSSGTGGAGTTTATTATSTTKAASTGSTSAAQTSTGTGGPANCTPGCMNYVAMPVPGCPITQMDCETTCQQTIAGLPAMCADEYIAFFNCTSTAPRTSFTCGANGFMYTGSECDAEKGPLGACVGG